MPKVGFETGVSADKSHAARVITFKSGASLHNEGYAKEAGRDLATSSPILIEQPEVIPARAGDLIRTGANSAGGIIGFDGQAKRNHDPYRPSGASPTN